MLSAKKPRPCCLDLNISSSKRYISNSIVNQLLYINAKIIFSIGYACSQSYKQYEIIQIYVYMYVSLDLDEIKDIGTEGKKGGCIIL